MSEYWILKFHGFKFKGNQSCVLGKGRRIEVTEHNLQVSLTLVVYNDILTEKILGVNANAPNRYGSYKLRADNCQTFC